MDETPLWPISPLRSTDEFGWRKHPIYGDQRLHRGIDLYARGGQPVWAIMRGSVSWAGYNGGEGNSVHVDHDDGSRSKYFHGSEIGVARSQSVNRGQMVILAGTTGASTGVHLHFETHTSRADSPVNPRDYMAARGAPFGTTTAGGNATPIETPEQADEREINMTTEQILRGQRDWASFLQSNVVGRLDSQVLPLLRLIAQRTLEAGEDLDTLIEAAKVPFFQVKPNGVGAAIDEREGFVKVYGSYQEWQNDVRMGLVSGKVNLVDRADFDKRIANAVENRKKQMAAVAAAYEAEGVDMGELKAEVLS
jgi:hypothetical protein